MKNDSDALKFSPQVMALAMPSESGFTKAAEGIGNVGKVLNEQVDRDKKEKLFNLQVQQAEQGVSLGAKQLADYDTDKALDRRSKTTAIETGELQLTTLKENKAESDLTKQMMNAVTGSDIYKQGKFDPANITALKTEMMKLPQFQGKEYLLDPMINKLGDEWTARQKGANDLETSGVVLENSKETARINKLFGEKKAKLDIETSKANIKHLQNQDALGWYNANTNRINAEKSDGSGGSGGARLPASRAEAIGLGVNAVKSGVDLARMADKKYLGVIDNVSGILGEKTGTLTPQQQAFRTQHAMFLRSVALAFNKGALTDRDAEFADSLASQNYNIDQYRSAVNSITSKMKNGLKEQVIALDNAGYNMDGNRESVMALDQLFVKTPSGGRKPSERYVGVPKTTPAQNGGLKPPPPLASAKPSAQTYPDGTIIRNPNTGGRMKMVNGQWVSIK